VTFGAISLLVSVGACTDRLPHPPYARHPTSALVEVPFPPPPARPEEVPPPPRDDAVWVDGEWTLRGRRWAWVPGRWVTVPPGSAFSPWTTVRRDDGVLFFAPGTWRDEAGEAIEPPAPLAFASVRSGVVFEPGGEVQRTGPTIDPRRQGARARAAREDAGAPE
jgi:hypothetical protein